MLAIDNSTFFEIVHFCCVYVGVKYMTLGKPYKLIYVVKINSNVFDLCFLYQTKIVLFFGNLTKTV